MPTKGLVKSWIQTTTSPQNRRKDTRTWCFGTWISVQILPFWVHSLKLMPFQRKKEVTVIFQPLIFRGEPFVSGRGCMLNFWGSGYIPHSQLVTQDGLWRLEVQVAEIPRMRKVMKLSSDIGLRPPQDIHLQEWSRMHVPYKFYLYIYMHYKQS